MASFENLTIFRRTSGLSQEILARFLLTSRSQVNMVEQGERSLTDDMIDKIVLLQQRCNEIVNADERSEASAAEQSGLKAISDKWTERAAQISWEKHCLKKELTVLETDYRYYSARARSIRHILNMAERIGATAEDIKFFTTEHDKALKKLLPCGNVTRTLLQSRIDLLFAEAGVISQYLQGIGQSP